MIADLLERYGALSEKADQAFQKVEGEYGSLMGCRIRCSDCCHAVFGLFLIEAAVVRRHFESLPREKRRKALARANKAEKEFLRMQERLRSYDADPHMKSYALSKERIRCPLLDEEEACILYAHRPITCRIYGIPAAIHGKGHVCSKARFKRGEPYPTFDLDAVHHELYQLSREMMARENQGDLEKASFLVSLAKAIRTPLLNIEKGVLE
jgi:Fe-S-cluster containining protein